MKKEVIIATLLGVFMLFALCGVGFAIWKASKPNKQVVTTQKSVKSATTSASESSLSVGDNSGIGAGIDGTAQSLNVPDSSGASAPSNNNQKPNFSEYEKYKDEKSALYADIKKGDGAEVKLKSKVSIYYRGYLLNGEMFDNQWPAKEGDKPKPFVFEVGANTVIPGLQQGILGMKMGGRRLVIIPPAAGYGDKGQGSIPPDSVLVFEIDLQKVE